MTVHTGRSAILFAGADPHRGGAPLRLRGLRRALARHAPAEISIVRCDRWDACRGTCQAPGRPRRDGQSPVRYYDRAFCPHYADRLRADLAASGVHTVIGSGLETYHYVTWFAEHSDLTVVFDMHNVELPLSRSIQDAAPAGSFFAEAYDEGWLDLVARAERAAIAAADEAWLCSEPDRALAAATYGDWVTAKARVVPNVVDPVDPPPCADPPRRVAFLGRMDYYPNLLAAGVLADRIAPALRELGCPLSVLIAGAGLDRWFTGRDPEANLRLASDPETTTGLIAGSIMPVPLTLGDHDAVGGR